MNRFPKHFHESVEQPLRCFTCESPLTEREADLYWQHHPFGQGEPYCFDCASQCEVEIIQHRQPVKRSRLLSNTLICLAAFSLGLATLKPHLAGYCVMAAIGFFCLSCMTLISKK